MNIITNLAAHYAINLGIEALASFLGRQLAHWPHPLSPHPLLRNSSNVNTVIFLKTTALMDRSSSLWDPTLAEIAYVLALPKEIIELILNYLIDSDKTSSMNFLSTNKTFRKIFSVERSSIFFDLVKSNLHNFITTKLFKNSHKLYIKNNKIFFCPGRLRTTKTEMGEIKKKLNDLPFLIGINNIDYRNNFPLFTDIDTYSNSSLTHIHLNYATQRTLNKLENFAPNLKELIIGDYDASDEMGFSLSKLKNLFKLKISCRSNNINIFFNNNDKIEILKLNGRCIGWHDIPLKSLKKLCLKTDCFIKIKRAANCLSENELFPALEKFKYSPFSTKDPATFFNPEAYQKYQNTIQALKAIADKNAKKAQG